MLKIAKCRSQQVKYCLTNRLLKNASTQTSSILTSRTDSTRAKLKQRHAKMSTLCKQNSNSKLNKTFEYEELILKRNVNEKKNESLGITLCYGNYDNLASGSNSDAINFGTNIFVAEISQGSVAEQDGRIRVGDQILQINGISIHSRSDALIEFSKPRNCIRLLIARTVENDKGEDSSDENINFAKNNTDNKLKQGYQENELKTKFKLFNNFSLPQSSFTNKPLNTLFENNNVTHTFTAEKATDSGLSRDTDSEEPDGLVQNDSKITFNIPLLQSYPMSNNEIFYKTSKIILEDSLEEDLANLHREMENVRIECNRLICRHLNNQKFSTQFNYQSASKTNANNLNSTKSQSPLNSTSNKPMFNPNLEKIDNNFQQKVFAPNTDKRSNTLQMNIQKNDKSNKKDLKFNVEKKDTLNIILNNKTKNINNGNYNNINLKKILGKQNFNTNGQLINAEETSSSAYNTGGDSCRSTPMNYGNKNFNCDCDLINLNNQNYSKNQTKLPNVNFFSDFQNNIPNNNHFTNKKDEPKSPENFYYSIDTPTSSTLSANVLNSPLKINNINNSCKKDDITNNFSNENFLQNKNNNNIQFRLPKLSIQLDSNQSNDKKLIGKKDDLIKTTNRNSYRAGEIMYTSADKLAETIAYQQRLLREAMIGEATLLSQAATQNLSNSSYEFLNFTSQNQQNFYNAQSIFEPKILKKDEKQYLKPIYESIENKPIETKTLNDASVQYEWKIKKRPDGTRYITRRPLRNQILKAREEEVNRERFALSTDDDATSEFKFGKYWNKNERRRHLERARQRKIRHLKLLSEKTKNAVIGGEKRLLQLSNAKQNRRNAQNFFDKFTTIQEFLAHGLRDEISTNGQTIKGILSVTTV